jgi:hypothetical protein
MTRVYKGTGPTSPAGHARSRLSAPDVRWLSVALNRRCAPPSFARAQGTASRRLVLCVRRSGRGKIGPGLCRRGMIELVAVWEVLINRKASIRDT